MIIKEKYKISKGREIWHIVLESDQIYETGDLLKVYPENEEKHRSKVSEDLFNRYDLVKVSKNLLNKLSEVDANISSLSFIEKREFCYNNIAIDLIQQHKLSEELLDPIAPRYYSIASSPRSYPGEIHLTVVLTCFPNGKFGAASNYLINKKFVGDRVIGELQKYEKFRLEKSKKAIMICNGTGIAPFIAFIQDAVLPVWLIFGEREEKKDFLYKEFLQSQKNLKITTAFSQDQEEKIYVQHRLAEHKKELLEWIEDSSIYICGSMDMGKAVNKKLEEILGKDLVTQLKREKRYLVEVY